MQCQGLSLFEPLKKPYCALRQGAGCFKDQWRDSQEVTKGEKGYLPVRILSLFVAPGMPETYLWTDHVARCTREHHPRSSCPWLFQKQVSSLQGTRVPIGSLPRQALLNRTLEACRLSIGSELIPKPIMSPYLANGWAALGMFSVPIKCMVANLARTHGGAAMSIFIHGSRQSHLEAMAEFRVCQSKLLGSGSSKEPVSQVDGFMR